MEKLVQPIECVTMNPEAYLGFLDFENVSLSSSYAPVPRSRPSTPGTPKPQREKYPGRGWIL